MKYLSLDIETTGLDEERCQVLEIAAVVEDTSHLRPAPVEKLPTFHCLLDHFGGIQGEALALSWHADLLRRLSRPASEEKAKCLAQLAMSKLCAFLSDHYFEGERSSGAQVLLAGKNVGSFDLRFLRRLPGFDRGLFYRRVLDPGMLYLRPGDVVPPDTEECARRAGIEFTKKHSAVEDARLVVELLRRRWPREA